MCVCVCICRREGGNAVEYSHMSGSHVIQVIACDQVDILNVWLTCFMVYTCIYVHVHCIPQVYRLSFTLLCEQAGEDISLLEPV